MPAEFSGVPESELSERFDLSVPADAEAIAGVVDALAETLEHLEVPEQKRFEIALAVQEALANAVVHGCGNDRSKQVRCQLKSDAQGRIVIIVTDPGPGFSPDLQSNRKHGASLYDDHGRGGYLNPQLMDEGQFEPSGSESRMWKY